MMITGRENIEMARVLAIRAALRLEIQTGMKRSSRGTSTTQLANAITGNGSRNKRTAYVALNDYIVSILGESFSKPLA
jgi:hypothetical protein